MNVTEVLREELNASRQRSVEISEEFKQFESEYLARKQANQILLDAELAKQNSLIAAGRSLIKSQPKVVDPEPVEVADE